MLIIDLTKAFDLVSRKGMCEIRKKKIGCPNRLRSMLTSIHAVLKGKVRYDGTASDSFPITSGVK